VVALDPKNADSQGNLGVLLYFRGDYVNAIPPLRAAVDLKPGLPKIQMLLGISEKRTGDEETALKDLEAAFPQLQEAHVKTQAGMELIELYAASDSLDRAAAIVAQLQQAEPTNAAVLYTAYRIYSDLAGQSLLNLSLVSPDSAQMHEAMAHEDARQNDNAAAIEQYRKALAIDSAIPGLHFELAELLQNLPDEKSKAEAEQQYLAALKSNPFDEKADVRLGDIALQKNDQKKAEAYYAAALHLQPSDPDANLGMAKILLEKHETAQATTLLEKAAQADPTNASVHFRLGTLYRQQGRMEDSKREIDEYKKLHDLKEKLEALYKEMRVHSDQLKASDEDDK
jgi:Tfp pilus assembly protein PilF